MAVGEVDRQGRASDLAQLPLWAGPDFAPALIGPSARAGDSGIAPGDGAGPALEAGRPRPGRCGDVTSVSHGHVAVPTCRTGLGAGEDSVAVVLAATTRSGTLGSAAHRLVGLVLAAADV